MSRASSEPEFSGTPGADRAERLLRAAGRHGPPVAHDFLAKLRERTKSEFARAQAPEPLTTSRRWQMMFVRAVSTFAATAALLGMLWISGIFQKPAEDVRWASAEPPPLADKAFSIAFARLGTEPFFDAELTDAKGVVRHVSGAAQGKLRFEVDEPGLYAIVDRDQQWQVNEAANRATESKADYYYRRDAVAALNPWRLLKLEPDAETQRSYREEERAENNQPQLVSYFAARYGDEPVSVEAKIDPIAKLPRELMIWPRENRGALPLARFHLIQAGAAGDETKFKVATTLTEDGRIGKVIDTQGLVTLRSLASSRWTPIGGVNALLQPNDWLRTDSTGANAVTVQLAPQTKLILGPGTLVELPKPDQLRVHSGIVQVAASDKTPITLTGPDGQQQIVRGKEIWQVDKNKLAKLAKDPVWLQGYVGQISQETLGSLVALVDGRNVNLSVGYHKVTVDIRDQIARTTIEESFVNHTNGVLEGQFYFPLPQDASISGFGMWIGDKLVEADIVEKGRAREIYETILREKRDPGLLEWAGGNIFKARVYPIPGQSEKRIKITYTQVLPLVGDSFRYSYALQSDLLKQNPLRQLELAVTIHSTQPVQKVQSPTHATRNQQTPHAARIEFSAQNYTPTRDFEVVTTLATRSQDLTLIPHQRGEDGFFMLLIQPPNHSSAFTRDLVNDGNPLELLILADTSASMDRASRIRQGEVIAALLAALAPQDKFNLATCDVDCLWTLEKPTAAGPEPIKKARDILARRRSMGWTNLQRGWESAIQQASPGAHIIYVGDGVITRGTQDTAGDVNAIELAAKGKDVLGHAISVSSSFESRILKAIAAVGGGSIRNAGGEAKPQQIAHDLLVEATRPSLRNVKITFEGIVTDGIYPPTLPNLPAGTQQAVLGRYDPRAGDQKGKVIVTGTFDGKPSAFSAPINLREAPQAGTDDDASFIPRLWARLYLDVLLSQGSSQKTQDEIIALSEEYHIITPYTSLLILEDDAQREQFRVKKRFQMRDGERFFQQGRKEANYALVQQQIQLAQAWRQQLRQKLLDQLGGLGRDANLLPSPGGGGVQADFDPLIDLITSTIEPDSWSESGEFSRYNQYMLGGITFDTDGERWARGDTNGVVYIRDGSESMGGDYISLGRSSRLGVGQNYFDGVSDDLMSSLGEEPMLLGSTGLPVEFATTDFQSLNRGTNGRFDVDDFSTVRVVSSTRYALDAEAGREVRLFVRPDYGLGYIVDAGVEFAGEGVEYGYSLSGLMTNGFAYHDRRTQAGRQALLPVPIPYRLKARQPRPIESSWPAEAVTLLKTLRLEEDLRKLTGGLKLDRQHDGFAPRDGELLSRAETRQLYSKSAWLVRDDELRDDSPLLRWCDDKERGNQSLAFDLALVRKSEPIDLQFLPALLNEGGYQSWDQSLPDYQVKLEKSAGDVANRVLLIAKSSDLAYGGYEEYRWLIDTERRVVLESERRDEDKLVNRTKYDKFVQIGGRWLATVAEQLNADEKVTSRVTLKLQDLTAEKFQEQWKNELTSRTRAVSFQLPLPKVVDAEKHIAAGQATLEDRLALLARHYGRNQRTEASAELAEMEKLAPGKAGWNWIQFVLLEEHRRHEELRQRLLVIAEQTATKRHPAEYGVVIKVRQLSLRLTGGNEQLELLAQVHPVYQRFATPLNGERHWETLRLESLANAGRYDEHREYLAQLATKYPRELHLQQQQVASLRQAGEIAKAFAWIEAALEREGTGWDESGRDQLRGLFCDMLESEGRYADAAKYAQAWVQTNPRSYDACQRLLAYLVLSGQEQQAFDLAIAWLDEHVPAAGKPLVAPASLKVQAAVQLLLGQGRNISGAELDRKHLPRLEKLLLQFAGREDAQAIVTMIWHEEGFRNSNVRARVLKTILKRVVDGAATLPLPELRRLCEIVLGNTSSKEELPSWKQVQQALELRWAAEPRLSVRAQYRELILRLCDLQGEKVKEALLRKFLADARPREKDQAALDLFNHWLNQAWSTARETESFQLIDQLSSSGDADQRLAAQLAALYRWTDTWEARRREYLDRQIVRPDKMKGPDLQKLHAKNATQAREEISQRLATAAAAQKGKHDAYARWLMLEHLTLEIRLERKLPAVADQLWQWLQQSLDQQPVKKEAADATAADDADEEVNHFQLRMQAAWQQRVLTSLLHLATRKDAPAAHVSRLRKLIEEQRQLKLKAKDGPPPNLINWQQLQYELLMALDLPKELLQALENFITVHDDSGHWRRLKARVLAELNRVEAAVQVFEDLESKDLLGGDDYRSLSVWYHALDEKQKHEAAQVKVYRQEQAWRLHRMIEAQLRRWQHSGGPLPEELDPQVLLMFAALLKTEDSPQHYLGTLRSFYEVTHDTRLLHALAKTLPGHTAERLYPMLTATESVLAQVEHEATIDEVIQGLDEVRKEVTTALDQRALDLLEVLAHRRAAELQNGAQPHLVLAVEALERASKREWLAGEPRLMAQFLSTLGKISPPLLAAAQVKLLEALVAAEKPGSEEHLHTTMWLAYTEWNYNRHDRALNLLTAGLNEYRVASGGKLNSAALDQWFQVVSWQEDLGRFPLAEQTLDACVPLVANRALSDKVIYRRYDLYARAIRQDALTSLGRGEPLYRTVLARLRADVKQSDSLGFILELANRAVFVFRAAHDAKIASARQDLLDYSRTDYPPILARQVNGYENSIGQMSQAIRDVAGPKEAIAFLLDRADSQPSWAKYQGNDAWSRWAYNIAHWRAEAKDVGDLTPRLVKFVVTELKRDLTNRSARNRYMYYLQNGNYPWPEQANAFAAAAEEVLKEQADSGSAAMYIGEYFFDGLDRPDRGLEIMLAAHRRKLLDDGQQVRLVHLLHRAKRYAESIALLEPLVKKFPLNLSRRCELMIAYFQTKQQQALVKLREQTHDLFHKDNRWTEGVMSQLGDTCLICQLYEPAVEYLKEAIAAHATNRTGKPCKFSDVVLSQYVGDGQLSYLYQLLARSYAGLKNTTQAVDAASSAVVVWTRRHHQREEAIYTLRDVLKASPDLPAYVKVLDQQTKDSGQDRPIVRKLLGEVFQGRKQFQEAIVQYRAAVQLSPGDAEVHTKLIDCLDALNDTAGAIAQSIDFLELNRRNFDVWQKLGARLEEAKEPDEAERARTSLVEVATGETEGHVKLAEEREAKQRFDEALEQWRKVAEIRKLEPTGLLNIARVQLQLKQKEAAAESIKLLDSTKWPDRFLNELGQKLPELKKSLMN